MGGRRRVIELWEAFSEEFGRRLEGWQDGGVKRGEMEEVELEVEREVGREKGG